jgi:hypothetical protein
VVAAVGTEERTQTEVDSVTTMRLLGTKLVDERCAGLHRLDGIEHCRQRLVLDGDAGGCLACSVWILSGDERDHVPDVAHPVDSQHRLVFDLGTVDGRRLGIRAKSAAVTTATTRGTSTPHGCRCGGCAHAEQCCARVQHAACRGARHPARSGDAQSPAPRHRSSGQPVQRSSQSLTASSRYLAGSRVGCVHRSSLHR